MHTISLWDASSICPNQIKKNKKKTSELMLQSICNVKLNSWHLVRQVAYANIETKQHKKKQKKLMIGLVGQITNRP